MHLQKIDDILTKSFSLWIISIIIAVGLWVYVIGEQSEEETSRTVSREIEYINVNPQLEIKNKTKEIWVRVSGREREIDDLLNGITCEADARNLAPGRYRIPVKVNLPAGISLKEIRPSQAEINLLRYADRFIDVEVVLPKDFPTGLYLYSVDIIPKQITVRGIENDIAYIERVKISPTMEELRSGKELQLSPELESSKPFEEKVNAMPEQVRFKAMLASGNPRRMIPVRARISGKPDDDDIELSTTIDPAEVLVEGPKARLDKLTFIETGTVDISGIKESVNMTVPVRPPQGERIKVLGEGTVKVFVTLQPASATKEITNIPVKIEGSANASWKTAPSVVTVTIEGLPSNIKNIAVESIDIVAFVNAENLFSRQAVLPVRTRLNSDLFKVVRISPFTVSVLNELNEPK
jgi:YbbR domain-containing protein